MSRSSQSSGAEIDSIDRMTQRPWLQRLRQLRPPRRLRYWLPTLLLAVVSAVQILELVEDADERAETARASTEARAGLLLDDADTAIDEHARKVRRLAQNSTASSDSEWTAEMNIARTVLPEIRAAFRVDTSGGLLASSPETAILPTGLSAPPQYGVPPLQLVRTAGGRALASTSNDHNGRRIILLFDAERIGDLLAPAAAERMRVRTQDGAILIQRPNNASATLILPGPAIELRRTRGDGLVVEIGLTIPDPPTSGWSAGWIRVIALLGASVAVLVVLMTSSLPAHLVPAAQDAPNAAELNQALRALEESAQERRLLHAELHHRVKNNLQVVSSLLNLQSGRVDDPAARLAMQDALGRIQAISLVHELLYRAGEAVSIDAGDLLQSLIKRMEQAFGGGRIGCYVEAASLSVPVESAVKLALITNELLTNAFRHAFPGQRHGRISVSFLPEGGNTMLLRVTDDGVGLPDTADFGSGLGRQLTSMMAQYLGGQVILHPGNPGTVADVHIPLDRLRGTS